MAPARPVSRLGFEVLIICALAIEADAVKALFDKQWDDEPLHYGKAPGDPNAYSTGAIGSHNVVLTYLSGMGKVHAAVAAANCRASFPNIKLALMVGICGAVPFVPDTGVEIVLGDVILSNGIIQYDLGRQYPERFERKDTLLESLGRPNMEIRTTMQKLGGFRDRENLNAKVSGEERDDVAKRDGVIGFEMESAGTWDVFPCIVIKGACDYADSHKTKVWQRYAAATAAACTKAFLEYWVPPAAGSYTQQSTSPSFTLPFNLSEVTEATHFVGRKRELNQMHSILDKTDSRRIVVLHGLGGIGKTQLVVTYLKTYRTHYSAVIWLNAKDKTSLQQSFARAATRILRKYPALMYIKAAIESRNLLTIVRAVHQWLEESDNDRWLLVFDNYDNPKFEMDDDDTEIIKSGSDQETSSHEKTMISPPFDVRPFFPDAYQGGIIITTRSSTVEIGKMISLKKLTDVRESLDILSSASHRQIVEDDEAAIELAKHLDGLPLALATAGSYLKQVTVSWAEYLQLYRQSWLQLQETSPTLLSYENRALYSTWNISYQKIEQKSQAAAMMLHLWAYFDNEDLWYELLHHEELEMPDWLKETVRDNTCFVHVFGEGSPVDTIGEWCFYNFGFLYADQGQLKKAEEMYNRALKDYEKAWGSEHISTLETVNSLGNLYAGQGRLKEAEDMYNRALEGKEKVRGPEHTSTLHTVNNLGALYANQGRLKEAEDMHNRALKGYEKAWGSEHTSTLETVNNLAILYAGQGRMKEAEDLYNRALKGKEKVRGPEHTSTLDTVNNLGLLYAGQGRLKEAEEMYNRALKGKEKVRGPEHTSTLDTVNNLGLLYAGQGRMKEAEDMYNRIPQGHKKT
ncbi:hypothetical protein S40288_08305 [Stachybotrys chartarum IBT 40288]|nr:hypothetical protein S40288_08305 [Stachybotrys chartarum IBT 40288]